MSNHSANQGFSLIELAIVLVIIGLLTGGVLLGKNLIRNADVQTVLTDFSKYKSAANQFKDKYMALPGDFAEATAIWGKDNAACAAHSGTAATPGTCNGNGDGRVWSTGVAGGTIELFQFWKQLQLEGLIPGNYSGLSGTPAGTAIPGENCPESQLKPASWNTFSGGIVSNASRYLLDYGNEFEIGLFSPQLTTKEAWAIDMKADDGLPAKGFVIVRGWSTCAAADDGTATADDLNATYLISDTSVRCSLFFVRSY